MTRKQIIHAWRDGEFYGELDDQQRARIPANPVGLPIVSDDDLRFASGGAAGPKPTPRPRSKGFLSIGKYCTSDICCCPF